MKEICIINPRNKLEDNLEVSFIPMGLIEDGFSNFHTSEVRVWKDIKKGYTHFAENDIAVAKITPCFENRKSAILKSLKNKFGAGTTELHILRCIGENILAKFILYFFKSPFFIENGKATFTGTAGQQRISSDFISNFLIPLPPLAEQQRIVEKIDMFFSQIDRLEQNKDSLKAQLNTLKTKILHQAITGKLVPQDPNDEPASELLKRIAKEREELIRQGKIKAPKKGKSTFQTSDRSPYGNLPSGWAVCRLSDICNPKQWKTLPIHLLKSKGYPVYGANGIIGYFDEYNHIEPTILITCRGATCGAINVSVPFSYINGNAMALDSLSKELLFKYIYYFFIQYNFSRIITGTAQPQITQLELKKSYITIPPISEQKRIVTRIERILFLISQIEDSLS